MKKFLAILMCAMMLVGVAACASTPAPAAEEPAAEATTAPAADTAAETTGGTIYVLGPTPDHGWTAQAGTYADKKVAEINAEGKYKAVYMAASTGEEQVDQVQTILANGDAVGVVFFALEDSAKAGQEALIAAKGEEDGKKACLALRTDGVAVDIDGDYTETLSRIDANKNAIGVFGLSFYQNNTDKLRVATINGVVPSTESIAKGDYPVSRPLYFYVKKAHLGVIPGLKEFITFFVSDEMAGPEGPLAAYGLVSDPELAATQAMVEAETPMAPLK